MIRRLATGLMMLAASLPACGRSQGEEPRHEHPAAAEEHLGHTGLPGYAAVVVDQGRQQLLGIRTVVLAPQPLAKTIRTVGLVGTDETRTSHVHVKFDGFIEDIYVDFTGKQVRKGQPLFKIYSRDLLAAQQEYLSSRASIARLPAGALGDGARAATRDLVAASRQRLELFDVPPSVLAQIERSGQPERAITVLAPQGGTVIEKQALRGLAVTPMMHLYVIADLSRVWVVADVYERDLAQVKVGQQAALTIDAHPGRSFTGLVTFISPVLEETTRTAKVRFEFPNGDGALKPSMFATVELKVDLGTGLAVPSDALVDTGERKIVFVAHEGGHFEPRAIKLGVALDGAYQVLEGLQAGDAIASQGQFLLDSESRIRGAAKGAAPAHGGH
jgi:Cu(I)/Ag(I) efflux system membrane fusion protein